MDKFITETTEEERDTNIPKNKIKGYTYVSIKNMAKANKFNIKNDVNMFNETL
ncbi:hypothetical protein FH5_04926 [Priestia endophytica]|nr:hypothetical protein FH5_04926 [Priestia endophytica]